jgi:hypothetical protein
MSWFFDDFVMRRQPKHPERKPSKDRLVHERKLEGTPRSVQETLQAPGQPLEPGVRGQMEGRFGRDFSQVRVHTGEQAAKSAAGIGALAYTVGSHIAFKAGQYRPETQAGQKLLAHELAHVAQQGQGSSGIEGDDPALEERAQAAGDKVAAGSMPGGDLGGSQPALAMALDPKDPYVQPSIAALGVIRQMETELAALRSSAPKSSGPAEESQRTFAVAKVLDASGKVKLTATGAYLKGGGLHAEEQALSKINPASLDETDTVLLMVDQEPCPNCYDILNQFRSKTKAEFRVFTRYSIDPTTRVARSTAKQAALKPWQSNIEVSELFIYTQYGKESLKELSLLKGLLALDDYRQRLKSQVERSEGENKAQLNLINKPSAIGFVGYWTNQLYNTQPPPLTIWINAYNHLSGALIAIEQRDIKRAMRELIQARRAYLVALKRYLNWKEGLQGAATKMQWTIAGTAVLIVAAVVAPAAIAAIAESLGGAGATAGSTAATEAMAVRVAETVAEGDQILIRIGEISSEQEILQEAAFETEMALFM